MSEHRKYSAEAKRNAVQPAILTILISCQSISDVFGQSIEDNCSSNNEVEQLLEWRLEPRAYLPTPVEIHGRSFVKIDDMLFAVGDVDISAADAIKVKIGKPWPGGAFVYKFDSEFDQHPEKVEKFETVCNELVSSAPIECLHLAENPRNQNAPFVLVVMGIGDTSQIGVNGPVQLLGIDTWKSKGKIAHEIKHALGWFHEHQHPRRDEFVEILWNNIEVGSEHKFCTFNAGNEGNYDFASIMHYPENAYAKPGTKTIWPRDEYVKHRRIMGQRSTITETDKQEISVFYERVYGTNGDE